MGSRVTRATNARGPRVGARSARPRAVVGPGAQGVLPYKASEPFQRFGMSVPLCGESPNLHLEKRTNVRYNTFTAGASELLTSQDRQIPVFKSKWDSRLQTTCAGTVVADTLREGRRCHGRECREAHGDQGLQGHGLQGPVRFRGTQGIHIVVVQRPGGHGLRRPEHLELTTLSDVIYLNVRNDVSFLISDETVLWEHQSTRNPNMPLRGLIYFGRLFARYVEERGLNVYGSRLVHLPTPRFVVFYNGVGNAPAEGLLRLSDSFASEGDVEVRARVVDINAGSGAEALERCEPLAGYAELVARVRKNGATMEFGKAVDMAVSSCIQDGVLSGYLTPRRAEVKDMFMTEYDEDRVHEWYREEGREEGREEATLKSVSAIMKSMGLSAEQAMDALDVSQGDRERYLSKL